MLVRVTVAAIMGGWLAGTSVSHMYDSDKDFLYQLTRLLLNEPPTALRQLGSSTVYVLLYKHYETVI